MALFSSGSATASAFGAAVSLVISLASVSAAAVPEGVWVRDGYTLSVAVDSIESPRFMEFAPDGTLFVSVPREGAIKACRDKDGDGHYESIVDWVSGHSRGAVLQGVEWHEGWLWFAEVEAIYRSKDDDGDHKADHVVKVLGKEDLAAPGGGHRWRALLIHKDRLYTHVGDQTNATDEPVDKGNRKKIWTFALDGTDKTLFASGVRNTERLVTRPGTDEIWGVDHDIDRMAIGLEGAEAPFGQPITDHNPPAELNRYDKGGFYGHPYLVGKNMPNLMFLDHPDLVKLAQKATIPQWTMAAHSSANSLCFYDGDRLPVRGDAFVAMKGGWNATDKVGYCLSRILFEFGRPYGEQKMVGFLTEDGKVLGRPVDCVQAPDGSILFSDDTGHKVYRLSAAGE